MDQSAYTFKEWCTAMDSVALRLGWGGLTFERFEVGSIVGYHVAWGLLPICALQLTPCKTGAICGSYPPNAKERESILCDSEGEARALRMENMIVGAINREVRRLWGNKGGREVQNGPKPRGMNQDTIGKLQNLYRIREDAITGGAPIPTFTAACELVGITWDTAKVYVAERVRQSWGERRHWEYSEFSEYSEIRNDLD